MITGFFLDLATSIIGFFAGLVPSDWVPPAWLEGAAASVAGFFDSASTMGVWIPLDLAFGCAYAIMTTYIGGGVVKGIRILISHFTGGGGGAA